MIDLAEIFFTSIWILGLAVMLTTISFVRYQSLEERSTFKNKFYERKNILPFGFGVALFCVGAALADQRWWAQILWIVLSLVTLFYLYTRNKERVPGQSGDSGRL